MSSNTKAIRQGVARIMDERRQEANVAKELFGVDDANHIEEKVKLVVDFLRIAKPTESEWVAGGADYPPEVAEALLFFKEEALKLMQLMSSAGQLDMHKMVFYGKLIPYKAAIRDIEVETCPSRGKSSNYCCAITAEPLRASGARRVRIFLNEEAEPDSCTVHMSWVDYFIHWSHVASLRYYFLAASRDAKPIGEDTLYRILRIAFTVIATKFCGAKENLDKAWFS